MTTVNQIQAIVDQYAQIRDSGADAKSALRALRPHIESLERTQREELGARIRSWEESRVARTSPAVSHPAIRPIKSSSAVPIVETPPEPVVVEMMPCPQCGKPNQRQEVFCYACGSLLEPIRGANETRNLNVGGEDESLSPEYFGSNTMLALRPRGASDVYEVFPQKVDHELIVGRSTAGSAMMPDIDLKDRQAENLGVSRMHLSIRYDPEQNALLATDLGSANGSFLNGQKMLPREIRALRHGDELRLGKLILNVSFRHPKSENSA